MLKGLITCILSFTCLMFQEILCAQTFPSDLKTDSVQQIHLEEMENHLIEMKISAISKMEKAIGKSNSWKPDEVRPSIFLSRWRKRAFSDFALSESLYAKSDLKTTSFSDPTQSLRKWAFENQAISKNELKSVKAKNELMGSFFSSRPIEEAYLQHLSYKQTYEKEALDHFQVGDHIEDGVANIQHDFTDVQKLSQRTEKLDEQISLVRRVYSEKTLRKIYDSLGSNKIDSLVRAVSKLSKQKMTDEELLEAITNSFPEYHKSFADTTHLALLEENRLTSLFPEFQRPDLNNFILSDSITQSLPEINADRVKSQYLKVIDSIRLTRMKYEGYSISENPISDNIKASIVRQKQKIWDHLYFDGVLGVLQDGSGTILKVSPSLGYNISNFLSIGIGPSILLNKDDHEWSGKVGVRSFLKGEIWHQRMYIQLEDNIDPIDINTESTPQTAHSILGGVGCLLPISKTIAINPSIFYRINNSEAQFANASPWVFRIGISSITKQTR